MVGVECANMLENHARRHSPFTTSFTHARSAKMSRLYSGRRRGSMVASIYVGRLVTVAGKRPRCAPRGVFARACRNRAVAI